LTLHNGRRVLSRGIIIDKLWKIEKSPEDIVKAHIKSLRQKLGLVAVLEKFIETVHGVEYRLKQI
jgi:DNA-binding response OmpR family regulator